MTSAAHAPRVALVHDWLTGMRGGERVLEALCRLLPAADLLTLLHVPGACPGPIENRVIRTSFLNSLPGVRRYYRHLLGLMPRAIESFDTSGYDVLISTSHCVAKGIRRGPEQLHVCYCFTPMRYIWAVAGDYHRSLGVSGLALKALTPRLKEWDRRTAAGVDLFIADSACVAERIDQAYGRSSVVLHPPVNTDFFTPADRPREDFYLMVTALAPYKKVDQAVEACQLAGRRLVIIGSGPEMKKLRRQDGDSPHFQKAKMGTVPIFLGWRSDDVVRDHYRRCRALLFPQVEDAGIVPLEAFACGAPVIALAQGGALETVRDAADAGISDPTGLLYGPQTPEALAGAIAKFESPEIQARLSTPNLRRWAEQFSIERFLAKFKRIVDPLLAQRGFSAPW